MRTALATTTDDRVRVAGIASALVYWTVISSLIRRDQLGEVLGLLTVVPSE